MLKAWKNHSACTIGDLIYIIGGETNDFGTKIEDFDLERYSESKNEWESIVVWNPLFDPFIIMNCAMFAVDKDNLLVLGGIL